MNVIVLCEFSGIVRDAFIAQGHNAVSVDLLPSERPGPHIQGDIQDIDYSDIDLVIAHPPCTYLCNSGVRWLHERPDRWPLMREAAGLFRWILDLPVPRIAIENPVMHKHAVEIIGRRQDQSVQPYEHGYGETKRTCLWLKGLPKLTPTQIVSGREGKVWRMPPSANRWKERSRTCPGIAEAMAQQWGLTNITAQAGEIIE